MTALQNIRTQLKAILKSISGIGNIYPYYRYKKNDLKETLKLFKEGTDYKGIMFRELSCTQPIEDNEDNEKKRKWEFTMLRQVNDEKQTALQFEDLIEEVIDTINENSNLNDAIIEHNNLQLIDISERMIGDVLCHQALLNLETRE